MAQPPKYLRFPQKLFPAAMNNLINLDAPRHMELRIQQKDSSVFRALGYI